MNVCLSSQLRMFVWRSNSQDSNISLQLLSIDAIKDYGPDFVICHLLREIVRSCLKFLEISVQPRVQ
jgi:hypothetical protein